MSIRISDALASARFERVREERITAIRPMKIGKAGAVGNGVEMPITPGRLSPRPDDD